MFINIINYIINPLCQQTLVLYLFCLRYHAQWCGKYNSKYNTTSKSTRLVQKNNTHTNNLKGSRWHKHGIDTTGIQRKEKSLMRVGRSPGSMSKLTMKLRIIISVEVEDQDERVGEKQIRLRKLKRHFQNCRLYVRNFSSS